MRYLLKARVNQNSVDILGWTPLHYAVALGHEKVVLSLLGKGAAQTGTTSKDLFGWTPLHYAATEHIAWILLQEGAQLDIQGRDGTAALHHVAKVNRNEMAQLYIEAGANIDIFDNSRMTPLHLAAYRGHEKTVELLVEKGANTTARDDNGRNPLHLAAVAGTLTTRIAHLLKANKKDFAASDRRGLTALHFTAMAGKMESTRFILVGESANVKPTNSSSQTALSNTVENDHTEFQADVNAKDRDGLTPLHRAAAEGHEAAARTLIVEGKADVRAKDN